MLKTVLLVDDEEDIRTIGEMSLANLGGLSVTLAGDGNEALATIEKMVAAGNKPDVVLLDVMMPDMDGPTTLVALRADPRFASVPVIFMTAKVLRHEVEEYMQLGAAGVIQKPFDPVSLPDDVRKIVSEQAEKN